MQRSSYSLLFSASVALAAIGGGVAFPFAAAQENVAPPEDGLLSLSDEPPPSPPAQASAPQTAQPAYYGTPQQRTPETAALPDALDIISSPEDKGFKPSYGGWPYSIMYPSNEISNLKNILALYERKGFIVEQSGQDDLYRKFKEQPIPPDLVYPSFKLRSIVYRGVNEWSVWLNNRHISNETNKPENEIIVVSVNKEFAEFAWIPTNAGLLSAMLQLRLLPEGSRPETSETPKHRKATSDRSESWLDKATSVAHFVLRPNQTFYSETFEIFEGAPDSIAVGISHAIQSETGPNSSPITPENDPTQSIKELQQQLEGQQQPKTLEQETLETIGQKGNPKAQIMRALGLGK